MTIFFESSKISQLCVMIRNSCPAIFCRSKKLITDSTQPSAYFSIFNVVNGSISNKWSNKCRITFGGHIEKRNDKPS